MEQSIQFLHDHPVLKVFINLIISVVLIMLVNLLLFKLFRRIWDEPSLHVKKAYRRLKIPLIWLLVTIVIIISLQTYAVVSYWDAILLKFLTINVIVSIAFLLIRITRLIQKMVISRLDVNEEDNLQARKVATQLRIFEKFIIFIIVIIAISGSLMVFEKVRMLGVNILASAGIAGIIVGFAAQKSIATILAGIQIALTQPIRIDDVVIVEGEWGWIEEINLTYVVVKIWDLRRLIVPINYFLEKPFQNWTRTSAEILGTVFLYLDYNTPIEEIRKELTKILEQSPNWDKKVNNVQVTNADNRTMEVRALMSAKDSPTAWNLRVEVREKLIDFMQKNYPESLPKIKLEKN